MKNYGRVHSTDIPHEVEITSNAVYLASNIVSYEKIIDDKEINGYEYDLVEYTKDEYIQLITEQNAQIINELKDELNAAKILLGVE